MSDGSQFGQACAWSSPRKPLLAKGVNTSPFVLWAGPASVTTGGFDPGHGGQFLRHLRHLCFVLCIGETVQRTAQPGVSGKLLQDGLLQVVQGPLPWLAPTDPEAPLTSPLCAMATTKRDQTRRSAPHTFACLHFIPHFLPS